MNQGHDRDGSGWGSSTGCEHPGLVRAWLRLATMEAQSGLGEAETGVQARARMRRADALAAQSCRAQLRQWQGRRW